MASCKRASSTRKPACRKLRFCRKAQSTRRFSAGSLKTLHQRARSGDALRTWASEASIQCCGHGGRGGLVVGPHLETVPHVLHRTGAAAGSQRPGGQRHGRRPNSRYSPHDSTSVRPLPASAKASARAAAKPSSPARPSQSVSLIQSAESVYSEKANLPRPQGRRYLPQLHQNCPLFSGLGLGA